MEFKINIDSLNELIKIHSLSSDELKCRRVLEVFEKMFVKANMPTRVGNINHHPYLIAGDVNVSEILFLCHLDVVSAGQSMQKLIVKGDKVFGRGVLDMKGPTLAAFESIVNLPDDKRSKILFVLTTDEEVGGLDGASQLVHLFKNIKLALVPDGGSGESVVINQKAPLHTKVIHRGLSVHASKQESGVNSVEILARCSLEIVSSVEKCCLTVLNGGTAMNKVPDSAEAILDIRLKNRKELINTRKILSNITAKYGCSFIEIDKPLFFEANKNNALVKKFFDIRNTGWAEESGSSDGRFLWSELKIPIIMTSVVGGGAHSENEWASIKSLNKLANDIYRFINNL